MLFPFSRAMANKIMDHMPNLLLLRVVIPRQHLLREPTLSNNNSMDPPMASQPQVGY